MNIVSIFMFGCLYILIFLFIRFKINRNLPFAIYLIIVNQIQFLIIFNIIFLKPLPSVNNHVKPIYPVILTTDLALR